MNLRPIIEQLDASGLPQEALGVWRRERKIFGVARPPVIDPAGHAWRVGALLIGSDGNLYATAKFGGTTACTGGSIAGTWGCGAVVRIVPGDGTNLGGGGGGGGTDDGDNESAGGGDGTTLGLLLLLLAFTSVMRRNARRHFD